MLDASVRTAELLRFRSGNFPAEERVSYWRETLSAKLLKMDVAALADRPFHADASLRCLPGLAAGIGAIDPSRYRRDRAVAATDNDDIVLLINLAGSLSATQDRGEFALAEGDGFLMSCTNAASFQRPTAGRMLGLRVPHAALDRLVPRLDDGTARPVPRGTDALRLLESYVGVLSDNQAMATPELRRLAVSHVHDLLALVLNPTQDVVAEVGGGGLRAARLRAVERYIERHLRQPDLAIDAVAASQGLSPRQVQRLFEREGITFSQFLLTLRLKRIYAALRDARQSHRNIGDIALDQGIGDISHFNHAFRRQFGATPSEVRNLDPPT